MKRVYVDTSVFGGIADDEFKAASLKFFDLIRKHQFVLVTSPIVEAEIALAPHEVRNLFDQILQIADVVTVTQEAIDLRNTYLQHKILSSLHTDDALHVALATISNSSMIISWNFKHIVHFDKIPLYNAINLLQGYPQIAIYSPLEVI